MNWEEWVSWKKKKSLAALLFIVAYVLTIPIRDYSFLEGVADITQGVPIWVHLIIAVIGAIVVVIGLKIIEIVVGYFLSKDRR